MTQTFCSTLTASRDDVWRRVTSPEGINHELRPWLTMTMPARVRGISLDQVPVGQPLGKAWLRLFGILPCEYDDLVLTELAPGRFREESRMLLFRRWVHEREVRAVGDATEVTDRLSFELRPGLGVASPVAERVVRTLFEHRHRRLRAFFRRAQG